MANIGNTKTDQQQETEVTKDIKDSKNNTIRKKIKTFLMQSTNGMAIGLFGTLIIGTILDLFAKIPFLSSLSSWTAVVKGLMGAGIGLGVALSLKQSGVMVVAVMAAGAVGNYAFDFATGTVSSISDPLSCYLAAIISYFAVKGILRKKTPVDLILIPLIGIVGGILYSFLLAKYVHYITTGLGWLVEISFDAIPFVMCIIVSVLVGMVLTAPISSVAMCVAIQIGNVPLAAMAALIGCSTQMVGFAVETAYDNKWGSVLAVGLGTSMLQFKNILRKPLIWLPTIIVSAILGPLAMLMPVQDSAFYEANGSISSLSVAGGMGTSGLVGTINTMAANDYNWIIAVEIIAFTMVLPMILVFLVDLLFRKFGWIKKGDFSLTNDI